MKPERIIFAKAIDNKTLIVKFTNHEVKKYDASRLLNNPTFSILHNPVFFRNFSIEPHGYALVWNDDVDISEYELWQNGVSATNEEIARYLQPVDPTFQNLEKE